MYRKLCSIFRYRLGWSRDIVILRVGKSGREKRSEGDGEDDEAHFMQR